MILKEQFYYVKYNDELISNSISSSKWKQYSKIGDVEETIKLELIKASYEDGAVSLRYKNGISSLPKLTVETIWANFKFTALFKPIREWRLKI